MQTFIQNCSQCLQILKRGEKKKGGENSKYLGGGEIRLRSVAAMMGTILFLFSWEWKTISSSSLILRPPKVRR